MRRHSQAARDLALYSFSLCLSFALCWHMIFSTVALTPYKGEDGQLVLMLCRGGSLISHTADSDPQTPFTKGQSGHAKACPFAIGAVVHTVAAAILLELDGVEFGVSADATRLDLAVLRRVASHQPRAPPRSG